MMGSSPVGLGIKEVLEIGKINKNYSYYSETCIRRNLNKAEICSM
jgi:hypothetical protein